MRQLISSLSCFVLAAAAGCAGKAPPAVGDDAPDPDAGIDAPPEVTAQQVSGKTMDYFTANTPMADAMIASDGVEPPMMATSAMGGDFAVQVPVGSKVYFTVTLTNYRPTRNAVVSVEGDPVMTDLYMITTTDANRQYTTAGLPPTQGVGKAILIADLVRNNGMPFTDVPLLDVTLVDALDQPVPGIVGPFAMGVLDIDPAALSATAINGRTRIAILDVPPGVHTLKVNYLDDQLAPKTMTVPVATVADGATLAATGNNGGGGGGNGGGMITNPTFTQHIYPRLQRVTAGGLGCANCHTALGQNSTLQFDLPAADVHAQMIALPGVIDLIDPAVSLFLTKPLYEPPPANHPNATFIDVNDLDYKLFLLWITQGALL